MKLRSHGGILHQHKNVVQKSWRTMLAFMIRPKPRKLHAIIYQKLRRLSISTSQLVQYSSLMVIVAGHNDLPIPNSMISGSLSLNLAIIILYMLTKGFPNSWINNYKNNLTSFNLLGGVWKEILKLAQTRIKSSRYYQVEERKQHELIHT